MNAAGVPVKREVFKTWRCLRCGHEITSKEEAHDHRVLNFFGPNKCRKVWARLGMPKVRTGTRYRRRMRDIEKLAAVAEIRELRKGWAQVEGMVDTQVEGRRTLVRVWRVQKRG